MENAPASSGDCESTPRKSRHHGDGGRPRGNKQKAGSSERWTDGPNLILLLIGGEDQWPIKGMGEMKKGGRKLEKKRYWDLRNG